MVHAFKRFKNGGVHVASLYKRTENELYSDGLA